MQVVHLGQRMNQNGKGRVSMTQMKHSLNGTGAKALISSNVPTRHIMQPHALNQHWQIAEKNYASMKHPLVVVLASIYLAFAVLSPSLFYIGNSAFRIDDVILLFLFGGVVLLFYDDSSLIPPRVLMGFAILLIAILIPLLFAGFRGWTVGISKSPYHELFRLMKYFMVFVVFCGAGHAARDKRSLLRVFLVLSSITVLISLAQAFNLLGINHFITSYYRPGYIGNVLVDPSYRAMGGLRAYSTFYNANVFGLFLIIPLSVCFSFVIQGKSRLAYVPLTGLFFAGILLSQSRTALLCGLFSLSISVIIFIKRSRGHERRLMVNVVIAVSIILISFLVLTSRIELTRIRRIAFSESSVQARGKIAKTTLTEIFEKSPIVGFSTVRLPQRALDNEYIYFLYFGGLLGLVAYVLYLVLLFRSIPKSVDVLTIAVTAIFITFLIANLSLGTYFSERPYVLFLAVLGLALQKPTEALPRDLEPHR